MKNIKYLAIILSLFIFSCGNASKDEAKSETSETQEVSKNETPIIPDDWDAHSVENVKFGLPKTWNRMEMEGEDGSPINIFYEGEDLDNAPYGIIAEIMDDYDSGLDYFESNPDNEIMNINGQIVNVISTENKISVLMPRIRNSNKGLIFDFMANNGDGTDMLKKILNTSSKQEYQAPEEPLKIEQIAEILESHVSKRGIPNLEFSFSDPCENVKDDESKTNGTPWDNRFKFESDKQENTLNIPKISGLEDIENLSMMSYNAAVSTAFEGMSLLYGPMNETEYKQFQSLWNPLFDYPTEEIVEYLNTINPLIGYFLSTKDAYMQTISDFELLMIDAAMAVEFDNQEAWEEIMGEAQVYANTLQDFNNTLQALNQKITALGNPPNPNEQKCRDNENYRRFFSSQPDLNGTWQSTRTGNKIWIRNVDVKHEKYQGDINKGAVAYYIDHIPNQNIKEVDVSEAEANRLTQQGAHVRINTQGGKIRRYINEKPNIGREGLIGDNLFVPYFINRKAYMYKPISRKRYVKFELINGNTIEVTNVFDKGGFKPRLDFETYKRIGDLPNDYLITYGSRWKGKWKDVEKEFENSFFNGTIDGVEEKHKNMLDNKNIDELRNVQEIERGVQNITQKENDKEQSTETLMQADEEKIAFHQEMVNIIEHTLNRDIEDRNKLRKELRSAKTPEEANEIKRRIKDYDLRIIHQQTSLQQEKDLIASHKTGKIVRNRTAFDEYAKNLFINSIKENAARVAQTQKIANGIERQINLLPKHMRPGMREKADKILDGKIAEGDVETARKLANSLNDQITGMAEYDLARAQEAEIDAQQNEFYAQMTIMAAGAGTVGLGSQALTSTFGVHSAASIYGAQVLGGVYGGTTGLIAGGPQQGISNAISGLSPYGNVAVMFVDGYQNPALQEDADMSTRIFEGAKAAGAGYLMGKAFEFGAKKLTNSARIAFGKNSRLFKPVIPNAQRTNTAVNNIRKGVEVDGLRTAQEKADARSIIKTYESLDKQLAQLKANPTANATKIANLEKELNKLTASMNASYTAKWVMKYEKPASNAARIFDNRLQSNYNKMIPGMKQKLAAKGYILDDIDFKQFRNHNSAGTSSMDLDLVPVSKKTGVQPNGFRKQDGSIASVEEFMHDAQANMDNEWYEMFGISTKTSEMNLVTSAHGEAFASPKMLDKNLDFSELTVDELKSVGKVLNVKTDGIDKNIMLSSTQKIQAKSREASKEVGNFINRKLKQDLSKVSKGTAEYKQLQADISYWEDMESYLKKFGTTDLNPIEMRDLNVEMMRKTGGNGVTDVVNDVITYF
jgi:hypothetical protein